MADRVVHFEIIAPESDTLAKFYSELFGWHTETFPDPPYTIIDTHAGRGINGGIGSDPQGGTRVTFYVAVDDMQKTLDQATKLGGSVVMPITELPMVKLAMFTDPQGNVVGIVFNDPTQEGGAVSSGSNPPISWFEVLGSDAKALADFYSKLFGWTVDFGDGSGPMEYGQVDAREAGIGGGIGTMPDAPYKTTVYAEVDDLQKYLDVAESLGAKTVMPPQSMGTVSVALFSDPGGNVLGLYKMN
jgi:uncharacterized protein